MDAGKFEQLPRRDWEDDNGSPDEELTELRGGARPNLENSTACQKSMPTTSSRRDAEAATGRRSTTT
jgi:hypothetical protein